MKAFYRKTFSICIFMAVLLMIIGIAVADSPIIDTSLNGIRDNPSTVEISANSEEVSEIESIPEVADATGKSLNFTGEISAGGNNLSCLESNLSANSEQAPGIESVPEAMFNIGENL